MENIDLELIKSVIKTKRDLENANKNFNIAEEELIDYYSYQIKANKAKLSYLIKEAKKQGYELDMINELKIKIQEKEAI
ncbi:MAG: DUF2508 family protein [Clostridia bacterium]